MLGILLTALGIVLIILISTVMILFDRVNRLEAGIEEKLFEESKYSYKVTLHEEPEELSCDEVQFLKDFVRDYLKVPFDGFLFNIPLKDNRPLHRHTWYDFKEKEFNWLRDLVLYPDKLEEEQEKIKLRKEIEEKKKVLADMD